MSTACATLKKVLYAATVLFFMITFSAYLNYVNASSTVELLSTYGEPLVIPLPTNLSNIYVASLDSSRKNILLAGEENGVTVATLIDSNYFEKYGNSYPILGAVTSFDVDDTYSPSFYAFGSSKGEALVLSAKDLRLVFRYIQADEFQVTKIHVSKNVLVAMFQGSRSFIKIFNLSSGGWSEIGEVVGNAPRYSMENVKLIDYSMLKFVYGNKIGTKDTIILAYFTMPKDKLLIQVINASTKEPLVNTIVYVRNDVIGTVYQGVTDREGYALVPIDLVSKKGQNITIFVQVERVCYRYTFTNIDLEEISAGVYTLENNIITVPGKVISQPPQAVRRLILDILDVSTGIPKRIKSISLLNVISINGIHAFLDVSILNQRFQYILVLSGRFADDPSYPSIRIMYLDSSFNEFMEPTKYRLFSDVSALAYSPDGRYLAVGTRGGVVYIFRSAPIGGRYEVLWGYRMPDQVTSISISNKVNNGYAITVGDKRGNLQVLYLPTANEMIPVIRINTTLAFHALSQITSIYASLDLNKLVVGTASKPYLILGFGDYIINRKGPINLDTRVLQPLLIRLITANGTAVANAEVKVYNMKGTLVAEGFTDNNGVYRVKYILPGTYNLTVQPPVDYLENVSEVISVTKEVQEVTVMCNYSTINVYFSILDSETKKAIEENVNFVLSGPETFLSYEVTSKNSSFYLKLLPGQYKLSVTSSRYVVGKPLYQELTTYINVPLNRNVTLYLTRNSFRLTLRFIDNTTRGPPREAVQALLYKEGRLIASSLVSAYKNTLTLILRDKGIFTLEVRPQPPPNEEPYYLSRTYIVNVTGDTQEVIPLYLNSIKLTLNIYDEQTGGPPLTPIKVLIDDKHVVTLPANYTHVTLEVTKGLHTLTLVPLPEYSFLKIPLYNVTKLDIRIVRKTSLNVTLERIYVKIELHIKDHYTGGGPAERLALLINGNKVAEIRPNASSPILFAIFLHKGENVIQLKGKVIYADFIKKVNIVNSTTIEVDLLRKLFTVKVVAVNDIGQKLSGGVVTARGINLKFEATSSIVDGEAYLKLPFGMYTIEVSQPGYEKYSVERVVDHDEELSVVLYPKIITLLTRYLPVLVGVSVIAAIIALIFKYRAKIKSLITPEEELF